MPSFTLTSLISVGIPFFIVSLASQNAPGIAILQANGYPPHTSVLLSCSSLAAILLAPWGGFSICIAAITAAICMAPDVHRIRRGVIPQLSGRGYFICWRGFSAARFLCCSMPFRRF